MEVGTEISQKIRSAIKAKLMELGAYVDDELPDYIMVMVANKKNKSQMKNDLSLFLGNNTDAFTTWLHGLLGKLQTITVDSGKGKAEKSKVSKEKKKSKDGKSSKNDSSKKAEKKGRKRKSSHDNTAEGSSRAKIATTITESEAPVSGSREIIPEATSGDNHKTVETEGSETSSKQSRHPDADNTATDPVIKESNAQEDVEDVRQLLVSVAPGDDLAQELDAVEEEVVNSQSSQKIKTTTESRATKESKENTPKISGSSSSALKVQEQKIKRKLPSSVVATVNRDQAEEEYDPFNPAVGNVASVVKVTSRKATVPPSMQANSATTNTLEDVLMESVSQESSSDNKPFEEQAEVAGLVALKDVKKALSEVLDEFQGNLQADEIGRFTRSVDMSLRQLDHRTFLQVRTQIHRLISDSMNIIRFDPLSGQKEENSQSGVIQGDHYELQGNNYVKDKADDSCRTERIIFNSESKKPLVQTSHGHGSKFYRSFVGTILTSSVPQCSNSDEVCSSESTNSSLRNTIASTASGAQSPVSTTKLDTQSSSEVTPSSSNNNLKTKGQLSATPSKQIQSSSSSKSSSTNTLSKSDNSATKCLSPDLGFHRLRSQILVDSLHAQRRSDAANSGSSSQCLLRHAWNRQMQLRTEKSDTEEIIAGTSSPHSPQQYTGEALKSLAKNLRVTIINRQALQAQDSSSDEDSSSEDESDEEDDDEDEIEASDNQQQKGGDAEKRNKNKEEDENQLVNKDVGL